jgi:hypothetical protein
LRVGLPFILGFGGFRFCWLVALVVAVDRRWVPQGGEDVAGFHYLRLVIELNCCAAVRWCTMSCSSSLTMSADATRITASFSGCSAVMTGPGGVHRVRIAALLYTVRASSGERITAAHSQCRVPPSGEAQK